MKPIFEQKLKGEKILVLNTLTNGEIQGTNKGVDCTGFINMTFSIVDNKLYIPQSNNLDNSTLNEVVRILKLDGIMLLEEYKERKEYLNKNIY